MNKRVLALDFGASSARAIYATLTKDTLHLQEIHRWNNVPVEQDGHLYWNLDALFYEVQVALKLANEKGGLDAIGIDTWGVDFGLLDAQGALIANPRHYRDGYTKGILQDAFTRISEEKMYQITGIYPMEMNTVFQLYAFSKQEPALWNKAKTCLMMPDLFAYLLTGQIGAEYSIASTSGILDCYTKTWSKEILSAFEIPESLLPDLMPAGTVRGMLKTELCQASGLPSIPIITVASHDTASAICAISNLEHSAFLSCGTWSLLGKVLDSPIVNTQAKSAGFSNECGYGSDITFLSNLTGLWLVQECKRQWEQEGNSYSFTQLDDMAKNAKGIYPLDTQEETLRKPWNIVQKIRTQYGEKYHSVLTHPGEMVRSIYEGLAQEYARKIKVLESLAGESIQSIVFIGGGAQGSLLPQLTADATGCIVYAGPIEATALGNIFAQLVAIGALSGFKQVEQLQCDAFRQTIYQPKEMA